MDSKKCANCSEYKNYKDSFSSWVFFIIGIIATVAIRIVAFLAHVSSSYAKAAWYVGVIGFFLFFIYKFRVSRRTTVIIEKMGLVEKIRNREQLADRDYDHIAAILCGLSSKKELVNYFFIFGLSALALVWAVYFDFFR